jgi:outer membrane protein W
MKKISIMTLTILLMVVMNVQAQFKVGATVGAQVPVGTSMDGFKTGLGLNLFGKYMLKENMAVGLNLGFLGLGTESSGGDGDDSSPSCRFLPVTGLFEYYFNGDKIKPYIGADMGLYNFKVSYKSSGITYSDSKSYFGFAPVVGILYELNDKISLLGNLKYHYVATEGDAASMIGIHFGAVYTIK